MLKKESTELIKNTLGILKEKEFDKKFKVNKYEEYSEDLIKSIKGSNNNTKDKLLENIIKSSDITRDNDYFNKEEVKEEIEEEEEKKRGEEEEDDDDEEEEKESDYDFDDDDYDDDDEEEDENIEYAKEIKDIYISYMSILYSNDVDYIYCNIIDNIYKDRNKNIEDIDKYIKIDKIDKRFINYSDEGFPTFVRVENFSFLYSLFQYLYAIKPLVDYSNNNDVELIKYTIGCTPLHILRMMNNNNNLTNIENYVIKYGPYLSLGLGVFISCVINGVSKCKEDFIDLLNFDQKQPFELLKVILDCLVC